MTWADTNSVQVASNANQRYIIEQMSTNNRLTGSSQVVGGRSSSGCNQVNTYRITARGASARGAVKFVQSIYSVLSC
jgi:Tfp pilus assembly protein PilX